MANGYQRAKEYQIPHNFKNNGRIFNMIEKEALTKALIWLVPVTIIIFKFIPIDIDDKFLLEILIGMPPVLAFSMGMDVVLIDIVKFNHDRKVYYNLGRGGKKNEDYRNYQGAYERAKRQEIANK